VQVQSILNEGYRACAAADKEIGQATADGLWSSADGQKYLDQFIAYRKRLDSAQVTLGKGDINAALSEANITQALADTLLKQVLARAAVARKAKVTFANDGTPIVMIEGEQNGI